MSAANLNILFSLWGASLDEFGADPPFSSHSDLYNTIDAIPVGGVPWQSATFTYDGLRPQDGAEMPKWMESEYTIWFRDPRLLFKNMLANQDFNGSFDYAPFRQYNDRGSRRYEHLMSGNWAWKEAVSACLVFLLAYTETSPAFQGYHFERPRNTWGFIRTHHSRQRQNDCFCCNRPQ